MRRCQKRGVVSVALVVVLLIAGLFVTGAVSVDRLKNLFTPSNTKQKAEVVTLTNDVQASKDALAKAQAAQALADANQKAADAAAKAKQEAQHEFVRGTGVALQKEANPSIYVQVAAILNSDADVSFEALPPDKTAEITALVASLTSADKAQAAAATGQLAALNAQLQAEQAKEHELEVNQTALEASRDVLAAQAASLQTQTVTDSKSLAKWAADNQTLLQKLKSFILWASIFAGLYFVVFYVLPALGKEFPALAPVAKAVAAVGAWPLHVLHVVEIDVEKLAHAATAAKLAVTSTALTAEQAAHASTTAALVSTIAPPAAPAAK